MKRILNVKNENEKDKDKDKKSRYIMGANFKVHAHCVSAINPHLCTNALQPKILKVICWQTLGQILEHKAQNKLDLLWIAQPFHDIFTNCQTILFRFSAQCVQLLECLHRFWLTSLSQQINHLALFDLLE